jgi:hypothetical protein
MSDLTGERGALVDAFAQLVADITGAPKPEQMSRLRALTAAALRAQLQANVFQSGTTAVASRWAGVVPDDTRQRLVDDLAATQAAPSSAPQALVVVRRDPRDPLLSDGLVHGLSALVPGERLGPFATLGGVDVWFDVFFTARRIEVRQAGVSAPALVFSKARHAGAHPASTRIDIEPGTVWIRGDLLSPALPAATFVGIKVMGGMLQLDQVATVSGDRVEIGAAPKGRMQLELAADSATAAAGACASTKAKVALPDSLTFRFEAGAASVKGTPGKATVWGQSFDFGLSTGHWTFIPRMWTLVLGYKVTPQTFDADPIADDLVHFEGRGRVSDAGLGLPVVLAPNPAILGEVAHAAAWFLQVKGLAARWYAPDPRVHALDSVWIGISAFGATILANNVVPLAPALTHTYELWTLAGGSDHRLPWRQRYEDAVWLFYRCHVVEGEHFLVQGQADVALDRPVTTNGVPVPTPTRQGAVLLHRFNDKVTAFLAATVADERRTHQFALRNALVWTSAPAFVFVQGALRDARLIDAGQAHLLFGVYQWAPTLPDPYVSNALIRRPRVERALPQSLLWGRVSWTAPERVAVSFEGQLAANLALDARNPSPEQVRPARKSGNDPAVGLTQVAQGQRSFTREAGAAWNAAQGRERESRGQRLAVAKKEDQTSAGLIDGFLSEVLGPMPRLLLLDVSTNQDLLGVSLGGRTLREDNPSVSAPAVSTAGFAVSDLAVHSQVAGLRVIALPQVQWEPVRTLDADQDIMTMGWFPTPLASATDGGATQIGARSQKMAPIIPEDTLQCTFEVYREGTPVGIRTTFPFGLIAAIRLQPNDTLQRKADLYGLTRPKFSDERAVGGIQITAHAEGGRPDTGGISPMFEGRMRQWLNGVDLGSGAPLGISVLGETLQPAGSVETVFNNDMAARPRVPVSRIDLSGYGGSNFSDWNNPFAAFAEAAKVQFRVMVGRTALEVIKVNSVLHPWGVRVTRSVTVERRSGGGVIRRDSGWQAFTPGIFDYRYFDTGVGDIVVAPYQFDAGVFRGLFNARTIRPAPGAVFSHGSATLVPYYFDADVALEGRAGLTAATGILGYLQTTPNGLPAGADALQALIEAQGPIGGPIDTWFNFGGSGLPFRAQRIEVGLANDAGSPLFVATVRGVPSLPKTGAWSVVTRQVAGVPVNGGEAVPVAENRGVPLVRRYPVQFLPGDRTVYTAPRLGGAVGDYRWADAADLLTPAAPANDYALLQSTPTHAFLFPRPFVPAATAPRIHSGHKAALADILARSTSKGAFPPATNTIELPAGSLHFDVGTTGKLALSAPISIVGHPTPLRISGSAGHGSSLFYDTATIRLELEEDRWESEFSGLRVWSDILGLEQLTGSELRVVGSTEQRPQIAEIKSLMLAEIEDILAFIPIIGQRGVQGPIDLGASNAKHEFKVDVLVKVSVPPPTVIATFPAGSGVVLTLFVKQSTGFDVTTGGVKASATFGANLEGKVPLLSVGVATVFLVIAGEITFSLTSVSGSVTSEKLDLLAFVGVGVEGKIGPFKAYAFLGVGFVLTYDAIADVTKYGGLVALEAGVDLVIVKVKIRAELKGLVYKDAGATKCDYSGNVKVQVDIFLIFSISATYLVTETTAF